jgi:hopanoid biosynthesis associated protein HpnK
MRRLVVTADDLGICREINAGIELAHRQGIVTSASVMTNMPAFADAVATLRRNPELGVGVHLVLTSGRPVSPPEHIPLLVDSGGTFRHGFASLCRLVLGSRRVAARDQIRREWAGQIETALSAGLAIDHLDSHRHVHMIPGIWPVVVSLAADYGCAFVRIADERISRGGALLRNGVKALTLRVASRVNPGLPRQRLQGFAGVLDSGFVTAPALYRLFSRLPQGTSEIVTHPGLPLPDGSLSALSCAPMDRVFLHSSGRAAELAALIDPDVRRALQAERIDLGSFRRFTHDVLVPAQAGAEC